jgi:hypothetical protein
VVEAETVAIKDNKVLGLNLRENVTAAITKDQAGHSKELK